MFSSPPEDETDSDDDDDVENNDKDDGTEDGTNEIPINLPKRYAVQEPQESLLTPILMIRIICSTSSGTRQHGKGYATPISTTTQYQVTWLATNSRPFIPVSEALGAVTTCRGASKRFSRR